MAVCVRRGNNGQGICRRHVVVLNALDSVEALGGVGAADG